MCVCVCVCVCVAGLDGKLLWSMAEQAVVLVARESLQPGDGRERLQVLCVLCKDGSKSVCFLQSSHHDGNIP